MKFSFPNFVKIAARTFPISFGPDIFKTVNADGKVSYVSEGKYINLLSDTLGYKYKIVNADDGLPNRDRGGGNWSGVIGVLQRGEADLGIDMLFMSEDRTRVVDFSYPYYLTDVTFITNKPETLPKSLAILYPFSPAVWLLLALCLFIVAFLFYFHKKKQSFLRIFFELFGSILEKCITLRFSLLTERFVVLTWVSGVMFLSYSYKGTLLAYLSFPPTKGVRDIDELVDAIVKYSYKCYNLMGVAFNETFMQMNMDKMRIIGKSLTENTALELDLFARNFPSKSALVYIRPYLVPYNEHLYLSRDSFYTLLMGIAVRRGFCCTRALDWAIRRIFESGLYDKFFRERIDSQRGEHMSTEIDNLNSLSLEDIVGAFLILASGYALAVLALVLEMMMGKFRSKSTCRFRKQKRFLKKRSNAKRKENVKEN